MAADYENDRDWTARMHADDDPDRGPITAWVIRARTPVGRFRQIARLSRAKSADEQWIALCREISTVTESIVEVQAYRRADRHPEATRAWQTGLAPHGLDDAEPPTQTAVEVSHTLYSQRLMDAAMLAHGKVLDAMSSMIDRTQRDADAWRTMALEQVRASASSTTPATSREAVEQATSDATVGQVIAGVQGLAATVINAIAGGKSEGPIVASLAALLESLTPAQLAELTNVLTPSQLSQLHSIIAMVMQARGEQPKPEIVTQAEPTPASPTPVASSKGASSSTLATIDVASSPPATFPAHGGVRIGGGST